MFCPLAPVLPFYVLYVLSQSFSVFFHISIRGDVLLGTLQNYGIYFGAWSASLCFLAILLCRFPSPDGEVEDSSLCFFPIISVTIFCPPVLCCFTGLACDGISVPVETRSFELLLNLQFLSVVIHD